MKQKHVSFMNEMNSTFGDHTIIPMDAVPTEMPHIPTGSLALDKALGIGGIPRGMLTELYRPEGAGKSTLALSIARQAQIDPNPIHGNTVLYIDLEFALNRTLMETMGINTAEIMLCQPATGTQAMDIMLASIGNVDLIVVDSIAQIVTPQELDSSTGDTHIGRLARLMAQTMRMAMPPLGLSQTALIMINQLRMKIGVMFGNPETQPGGRAVKFAAHVRLAIRRKGFLGPQKARYGQLCYVKAEKNKTYSPYRTAMFNLIWGEGIDVVGNILKTAKDFGVVTTQGSSHYFHDERIGIGKAKTADAIAERPGILAAIREEVMDLTCVQENEPN